jgi:transcription elongation factor GreA
MSPDSVQMTAEDLEALRAELGELEGNRRREVAARIKTAREFGDLKENAEYHAAKEEQSHLETQILRVRDQIQNAEVVERSGSNRTVEFGSSVRFTDRRAGREQQFRIVAARQAKPADGLLSVASPIATALLGHKVGDVVQVSAPSGVRELVIDEIS